MQTKEGASTCVRAKFGNISAVAALLWDPKPSADELSTRSPPSAALQQLAAACLCCSGEVPRASGIFFTYYNCCWILQVAASKRLPIYLWTGLVLLIIISQVTVAAGFIPPFYLVERCCAVFAVCSLLFEIPGLSNAKAVRFWFCLHVQIRIAWHGCTISTYLVRMI